MTRASISTFVAITLATSAFAACDQTEATTEIGFRSGEACANIELPEGPSDFAGAVELGEVFVFQGQFHFASTGATQPDPDTFDSPANRATMQTFHAGDAVAVRQAGELIGAIKLIGSGEEGEPTFVATQGLTTVVAPFLTAWAVSILACQNSAAWAFDTCYAETGATGCCMGKYLSQLAQCNFPGASVPAGQGAIWAAECESPSGGGGDGGGGDGAGDDNGGMDCGEARHVVDEEVRIGETVCEYSGWVQPVSDGAGGCVDTYDLGAGGTFSNCEATGAIDLGEHEADPGCFPL